MAIEGLDLDMGFDSIMELPNGQADAQEGQEGSEPQEQELNIDDIIVKNAQEKALEEVGEETKNEITPSPDDTSKTSKDMPFSLIHASLLKERGIISDYDEAAAKKSIDENGDEGEVEFLTSIIAKTIDDAKAELRGQYEEDVREYMTMLDDGVDSETAKVLVGNKSKLDSITDDVIESDDSVELRKNILFNHYKNTSKFADVKIEKLIQQSIDSGEDIDEAKEALSALKEDANLRIAQEKKSVEEARATFIKQEEAKIKSYKDAIQAKSSLIEGTNLTKAEKVELENMILKPIQTKDGKTTNAIWSERDKDPVNFDIWLAFAIKNNLHKGSIPDSTKKNIKSSVAQDFERAIASKRGGRGLMSNNNTDDFSPEKRDTDSALGL